MSERSELISRLRENIDSRTAYIKAKLGILVPSQIRALRLRTENMSRQSDLAHAAGLHQSRISMFETPGAANLTLETLARLAATFKVGLVIKFVPFSDMLRWENSFRQDCFDVVPRLEEDEAFLRPSALRSELNEMAAGNATGVSDLASGFRKPNVRAYEITEGSYKQSSGLGQKMASGGMR